MMAFTGAGSFGEELGEQAAYMFVSPASQAQILVRQIGDNPLEQGVRIVGAND